MTQTKLSRLEDLAQELVEGTFGRLFGGRLEPLDVANRLARAIEDYAGRGQTVSHYLVALNPDDFRFLTTENPDLAADISTAARQLSIRAGVDSADSPFIQLAADRNLKRRQIGIAAQPERKRQEPDQITQPYIAPNHRDNVSGELEALDAFLIIQGRRHIALNRQISTIGRRIDNNIVLDLSSVSRQHAIIRWRYGNFILYDVSSSGRTMVNGKSVRECVLRPGDVISLGDALLVYGEGNPRSDSRR